jgi:hypothetical protein
MIKTSIPGNLAVESSIVTLLEDLFWLLSPSCVIGVEVNLHIFNYLLLLLLPLF